MVGGNTATQGYDTTDLFGEANKDLDGVGAQVIVETCQQHHVLEAAFPRLTLGRWEAVPLPIVPVEKVSDSFYRIRSHKKIKCKIH